MKLSYLALGLAILAFGIVVTRRHGLAPAPESVRAESQAMATPTPQANPNQETNDRFAKQQLEKIAGRDNEPAEKVFKNIQIPWLKSTPAGRFVRIMNLGYSRALGVACTHYREQDFSSDDKRPKRAAREMAYCIRRSTISFRRCRISI